MQKKNDGCPERPKVICFGIIYFGTFSLILGLEECPFKTRSFYKKGEETQHKWHPFLPAHLPPFWASRSAG